MQAKAEGSKMSTERFTHLMVKGMHHRVEEMWISDQPFLLLTYLNTYMPWVGRQLFTRVVAPIRIKTLQEGGNIFDFKVQLLFICLILYPKIFSSGRTGNEIITTNHKRTN